jgi:colanic acid biosynthesis glycosyl transferase WcaI
MRILVIGSLYEPDLGPSAPLFTLLSENLVRLGHKVTVITMVPHYPSGQVSVEYRGRFLWHSMENGVNVIRVGLPSVNRTKLLQRFLQFLCYQIGATVVSLGQKYDVVLAANPFLTVWFPFFVAVVIRRKPAIYSVQDVYPNTGISLGIFKYKPVIFLATALELFCLNHAKIVHIISESFRPDLEALKVDGHKIVLVHNWVDTELIHPIDRSNSFAKDNKLTKGFVVLYAGNIGRSQGLEHVLLVAEQLTTEKDIYFVFVGNGSLQEYLSNQAAQRKLANVKFLPFQPRQKLPEVLASAHVSLVSLSKGIGCNSLPSKIYSIFASGRPVLASVDENCETWDLVTRADAGLCVLPENTLGMVQAILRLKNDPKLRERLGNNGRNFAEQHHSPRFAAEQFETLLNTALAKGHH